MRWPARGLAVAIGLSGIFGALAQSQPAPQPAPSNPSASPSAPAPAPAGPPPAPAAPPVAPVPQTSAAASDPNAIQAVNRANTEMVVTLVRGTLTALGQANQTGNYTVLRDLGAPDFSAKNSATDLAGIFTVLRNAKIDLAPVVLLDPQISRASLTPSKTLVIDGAFATRPLPITFELMFEPVNGVWRLDGLSITPVESLAAPSPPPPSAVPTQIATSPVVRKKPTPKPPRSKQASPAPPSPAISQ